MLAEKDGSNLSFSKLLVTSIIGALTFVVGLFWNDAIRATIELLVPQQQALVAKWAAALVVTALVIVVSILLYRAREVLKV
jgi:nucleoside recognition membrane protein YjiH